MAGRWSDTLKEYPELFREQTVVSLFRKAAEATPDKLAVVTDTRKLTYREVEEKSNQIVWAMKEADIQSGTIIGIRSGRSAASVCAMLAVWKLGCAYVYIDAVSPDNYNAYIEKQCHMDFIMSAEFIQQAIHTQPTSYFAEVGDPDRLAVIIFTSGSTGDPKGVMLSHRSLTASASNCCTELDVNSDDILSCFTSLMFVASVNDICTSFCVGCTLDLVPYAIRRKIRMIADYYREHRITVAYLPPHMAMKYMDMPQSPYLRLLMVGAEPARNLRKQDYRIVNIYASSEGASIVTYYDVQDERKDYPIGRPMPTYRIYIVDEKGDPVKEGETGELWLSGRQLFDGYLGQEELTSELLVPNPFSDEPDFRRVFKTRDLVSMTEEGLVCHGRADDMVKIRGFRVEVAGVETHMLEYPGIREACCVAFKDDGGTNILFGFYLSDYEIDHSLFRNYLNKVMPYYYVPTGLVQCEEFPRLPSGKVDRRGFAAPPEINDRELLVRKYK